MQQQRQRTVEVGRLLRKQEDSWLSRAGISYYTLAFSINFASFALAFARPEIIGRSFSKCYRCRITPITISCKRTNTHEHTHTHVHPKHIPVLGLKDFTGTVEIIIASIVCLLLMIVPPRSVQYLIKRLAVIVLIGGKKINSNTSFLSLVSSSFYILLT